MKQEITFNSLNYSMNFDGRFEPEEWMKKVIDQQGSSNGLSTTYTTNEPISEQLQESIRNFMDGRAVKNVKFNQ